MTAPPRGGPSRLERLSLNTATTKQLDPAARRSTGCLPGGHPGARPLARAGRRGRDSSAPPRLIRDAGLRVTTLCRGGFLTAADPAEQRAALDDNRARHRRGRHARHRHAGPGRRRPAGTATATSPAPGSGSPTGSPTWCRTPPTAASGWRSSRCTRCTAPTGPCSPPSARPSTSPRRTRPSAVGVVVDTFHVWWDPELAAQIARAGRESRIATYQVCDWNLPIAADAAAVPRHDGRRRASTSPPSPRWSRPGYDGAVEVEIFNADIWAADADEVVATMKRRYADLVLPILGAEAGRS